MALDLHIPDDIAEAIKLPQGELKRELTKEVAFTLYERGLASMGTSRRLSGLSKWEFIEGLATRGVPRHYYGKELSEDLAYARNRQ